MEKLNFWGGHGHQDHKDTAKHDQEEGDLTTLLSADERAELLRLVGVTMETMRATLELNFGPQSPASHGSRPPSAAAAAAATTTPETAQPEQVVSASSTAEQAASQTTAHKGQEEKEEEGTGPTAEFDGLSSALFRFFDAWRDSVARRLDKAVDTRDHAQQRQQQQQEQLHEDGPSPDGRSASASASTSNSHNPSPEALHPLYPPIPTALRDLPEAKRALILHALLLLLLSLEDYTAYSRVLLLWTTSSLALPVAVLQDDERKLARGLMHAAAQQQQQTSADEATRKHAEENAESRRWKVGLASVAGAALIGVTGGLAAPLVAAGVGGVMGGLGLGATAAAGYLGTLAGSSVLIGGLFGAYGGRMTGQMMDRYAHEVEDFAFLPVHPQNQQQHHHHGGGDGDGWTRAKDASPDERRLRVVIAVSGWLTEREDVVRPWRVVSAHAAEPFALRYELDALLALGNALTGMVRSAVWARAKKELIRRTFLAGLSAALWPLGLLRVGSVVDNPFSVARVRSDKAGRILADALVAARAHGRRSVTLVGYSLGARVVFACLAALAERRAFGVVEAAVLMGAPAPAAAAEWRALRAVVAGRLVNVYAERDYVLAFLYRASSAQYGGVAGLQAVEDVEFVENFDASELVDGHLRYRFLVGGVLKRLGFEDVELAEVEQSEEMLRMLEEKGDEAAMPASSPGADEHDAAADGKAEIATAGEDDEVDKIEREVQRMNQPSLSKPPSKDSKD